MPREKDLKFEQGAKRVRGFIGGELVFDTTRPLLVWENPSYPAYYIPETDVVAGLVAAGKTKETRIGSAELLDIKLNETTVESGASRYDPSLVSKLQGFVRFQWNALDEWLEEDEPVYTHPRDPYTRVDILNSSRRVEVAIDGVKVAASNKPTILFETRLPPRYYLPLSDVRSDLFRSSTKETSCPYKGVANYFSVEVNGKLYEDIVWIYRTPLPESQKIAGLVALYNEKVDLYVDGELKARPRTKFS